MCVPVPCPALPPFCGLHLALSAGSLGQSTSQRVRSRAGVGSQTWPPGSLLIWGLQPGASLSTSQPSVSSSTKWGQPSPACREAAAGCCELRAGPWLMRAVPSPPPSGPLRGSHLAGVLLALEVAGAQHAGRHLVAVGLAAQVLRDQLHIHLLQAVAGGACGVGLRAKVRGSETPGAHALLLATPLAFQKLLPRPCSAHPPISALPLTDTVLAPSPSGS